MSRNAIRLFIILFMVWTLAIIWFSLVPSPPRINHQILGWDKFQHAAAYALLTFLAVNSISAAAQRREALIRRVFLGVVVFGAAMEIAQGLFTPNRAADPLDFIANSVGAFLVAGLFHIIERRSSLRRSGSGVVAAVLFIGFICQPLSSAAEDTDFTAKAEISQAISHIGAGAAALAKYPFDLSGGGFWATVLVSGSVALTAGYDTDIRLEVARINGGGIGTAADAGTILGDPLLHLGIAAAVYGGGILAGSPKYRETGEMLGEALILADGATLILKQATGRGRPNTATGSGHFRPFRFSTDYDSFPSMHTSSSFAMASVMAAASESRPAAIAYYAAAAFVGFSRIYQDKHWASDVILGAAIGELCGRIVTEYHSSGESRIAFSPVISESGALLALSGRF